jgi:hypothetical protein
MEAHFRLTETNAEVQPSRWTFCYTISSSQRENPVQKWEYLRVLVNTDSNGRIMDITANEEQVFRLSSEMQNIEFNL